MEYLLPVLLMVLILVAVKGDSILEFSCAEKRDFFFRDPNGSVSDNAPILLSAIDNTKPFTFTAKITP